MKEVTEWNGKPRWMWCWDDDENERKKEYVVCILSINEMNEGGTSTPVRVFHYGYKHCAEIEEETKKETRLTNYELSQLLKCFGVDYTFGTKRCCENSVNSDTVDENEKVFEDYKIRYRQGELEEPTRETVWKWWGEETPDSDIVRFVSFIGWGENKE